MEIAQFSATITLEHLDILFVCIFSLVPCTDFIILEYLPLLKCSYSQNIYIMYVYDEEKEEGGGGGGLFMCLQMVFNS